MTSTCFATRDLKPANLLVSEVHPRADGSWPVPLVKISDFGTATRVAEAKVYDFFYNFHVST